LNETAGTTEASSPPRALSAGVARQRRAVVRSIGEKDAGNLLRKEEQLFPVGVETVVHKLRVISITSPQTLPDIHIPVTLAHVRPGPLLFEEQLWPIIDFSSMPAERPR
jgi:hypothetical protein